MSLLTRSDQNALLIQKKYLHLANHTLKSKAVSSIVVFRSLAKVCSDKLYRHKFAISPRTLNWHEMWTTSVSKWTDFPLEDHIDDSWVWETKQLFSEEESIMFKPKDKCVQLFNWHCWRKCSLRLPPLPQDANWNSRWRVSVLTHWWTLNVHCRLVISVKSSSWKYYRAAQVTTFNRCTLCICLYT